MDDHTFQVLIYIAAPLVVTVLGYFVKGHYDKLHAVEEAVEKALTKTDVRELLADKMDPIKEDITEIKSQINALNKIVWDVAIKVNTHD